ncbi:hypothetical protein ACOSQ4_012733 [Xanthoceras sorbifolium]
MMDGEMYRRGFSRTLQRCVDPQESARILQAIHGGVCGNHTGGNILAHKALRQGFYWPTMFQDAKETASNCDKCQRIADNIKQPPEKLRSLTSPWPFAQWGINLIGPMPAAKGQAKYAIVAVDYFTKWAEAEPLVRITEQNTTDFVRKSIIYRFRVPDTIISDNGTQFDNLNFLKFYRGWRIRNYYASVAHPQTNGQVEAVSKIIKHTIKAKLDSKKGKWAEKLPEIFWLIKQLRERPPGKYLLQWHSGSK